MSATIKIQGNFFILLDSLNSDIMRLPRPNVRYTVTRDGETVFVEFNQVGATSGIIASKSTKFNFTDLIDDRTGSAFASLAELEEFLSFNIGSSDINIYSGLSKSIVFVTKKSDFPEPTAGKIFLEANKTYFIYGDIDLTGDRIVTQGTNAIIGTSSETSSLTSTGIGADELINSNYTLVLQNITIKDVDKALVIDGTGNNVALDWIAVNFSNVTEIGTISNVRNFIYTSGAFLSSQGLKFNGTIGTISFFGSLFIGDATTTDDIIEVLSTATVERRFRVLYSTVSVNTPTTGINVSASATIPNEGFILDTVNFEGTGTYLTGLDYTSNKASFKACTGIVNSDEIAQYYMNANATATTITTIGTAVKVAGTTTAASFNQKFTHASNRATYVGSRERFFKVTATLSAESGNNNEIGLYIAKNGTLLTESEVYITTNAGGRAENGVVQTIVELAEDDYIEIFVENDTSTTDVTVTELNVIID